MFVVGCLLNLQGIHGGGLGSQAATAQRYYLTLLKIALVRPFLLTACAKRTA